MVLLSYSIHEIITHPKSIPPLVNSNNNLCFFISDTTRSQVVNIYHSVDMRKDIEIDFPTNNENLRNEVMTSVVE